MENKLNDKYNFISIRNFYLNTKYADGETYENVVRIGGRSYSFEIGTLNNYQLKRILIDFENINVKYPILIGKLFILYDDFDD